MRVPFRVHFAIAAAAFFHRRFTRDATDDTSATRLKTLLTRFWERYKTQNVHAKVGPQILSRRLKGTVFHCFLLSPCHHGHGRALGGSRQRTPIHPTAIVLSDGGSLPSGSSWPLEPRRSLRGPIGSDRIGLPATAFVRRPLGFWPSDYPAALGFPQSPPSHRASLPSGLTGCTDKCTLRDLQEKHTGRF